MSFIVWMAVLGMVLLTLALTASYLRWLPVTTSAVCLGLGVAIGPSGLGLLQLDVIEAAPWMEHLTEVALLFSLFVSGLKLRLVFSRRMWRVVVGLAGPLMLLSIAGLSLLLHLWLQFSWGLSLLVAAILAPTDPVLASLVQVSDAKDQDAMRFGLSGEAGLNDGVAFPFVLLGLLLIAQAQPDADALLHWTLHELLWAVIAGLALGYAMGQGVGRLSLALRIRNDDSTLSPNDYLALALIALAYVGAQQIQAYGFLAVFAAGLGLRRTEMSSSDHAPVPAEHLVQPLVGHHQLEPEQAVHGDTRHLQDKQVAAGVMMGDMLAFGGLVERAMEVFLVTLLGIVLASHWDWRALGVGLALFVVLRPLGTLLLPWGTLLDRQQRLLVGWFGIRGIGSLYYLFYCLNQGLAPGLATACINLTLSVVALSIVLHGLSTQPLLACYQNSR
ncbi:cation:proton antiporter [Pseudomonas sp. GD03860]|uniref:cation:proton antiporter n=1 Tax=Pseudomonas TaxID=286 RepID=UPI00236410C7|nr:MULTISPECIES: cation:proton antiporter [Pseudomonas]MDD2058162.1 cation:proton antiporter [Pseudomonas putida]MDH0636095.1 cation:proton antiporter [Pseudomonas sp. GD03860]